MALLVMVLLTSMILIVMVSISASMSMGARRGGVDERTSYQALNAAESGVSTFKVRVEERLKTHPLARPLVWSELNTWLQELSTYEDAALTYTNPEPVSGGFRFDLEATGKRNGATKKVLQGFELAIKGLDGVSPPRDALTAIPPIDATGNASISGTANTGVTTNVSGSFTPPPSAALTRTFDLPVEDTSGLKQGDYVLVSGTTLRVNSISGNKLNVTVTPADAMPRTLSSKVTLLLTAVAQSHSVINDPMTIKTSNSNNFWVGETVTFGTLESGKTAIVTAVDKQNKTVTFDWTSQKPNKLEEGEPIFRQSLAMRSAKDIDPKDNKLDHYTMAQEADGKADPDCVSTGKKSASCGGENDSILQRTLLANQTTFTELLFGMTDAEIDKAVPLSYSTSEMKNEVRRIPAANLNDVIKNRTSSGILIVDGDPTQPLNGKTTFNGFIYFRGNPASKMNGNLTVNGAVAISGGGSNSNLTGSMEIKYNAVELNKVMSVSTGGLPTIKAQEKSWRQQ